MDKKYLVTFASMEKYILDGEITAYVTGALRYSGDTLPVTGDIVTAEDRGGSFIITEIIKRKTELRRWAESKKKYQTLAANATHLLIVMAMDANFSVNRLDRFLVLASSAGIIPVVALTKCDLCDPASAAVMEYEVKDACGSGAVFVTSAVTGEGLDELNGYFAADDVVCLAGLSGAGKSTLLNLILNERAAETSGVRESDQKGKHTTTARQMYKTPYGYSIIDTPGIREVGVTENIDAVERVFSDITDIAERCRFSDCTHTGEPGCAVAEALRSGILTEERLGSYRKVMTEAQAKNINAERRKKERQICLLVKQVKKIKKR